MGTGGWRMLALALLATVSAAAAAERVLLEGADLRVTLDRQEPCGTPLQITVESGRAELFERDGSALQAVVDGARAVLTFECAGLPELRVQGRLRGLREPVYRAVATGAGAWVLEADRALAGASGVGRGESASPPAADEPPSVAGLRLGMTVPEASAAAAASLGAAARYDPGEGLLRLEARGCPPGYDWTRRDPAPRPGWKCLRAWFTDQRDPVLYRLELVQVLHTGEAAAAEKALESRYGPPAFRRVETSAGGTGSGGSATRLGWGLADEPAAHGAGSAGAVPVHTLSAVLEPVGEALVTTVTLGRPDAGAPRPDALPDLTL